MSKKVLTSYALLSAQSLGASFNSASTNCQFYDRIGYQLSWTGSAVGTIYVQSSIDNVTYANLAIDPVVLNNATDNATIDIQVTSFPYVRLAYTRSSGTGSIDVYISMKEAG